MRTPRQIIGRALLAIAIIGIGATTAHADPPGEDILYPGTSGSRGGSSEPKFYLQLDLGVNQSELYGANGFHGSDVTNDPVLGFQKSSNGVAPFAGLTLGYRFTPSFSVGVRLDYDAYFASNEGEATATCTTYDPDSGEMLGQHDVPVQDIYEAGASYIGISILPAAHFGDFFIYAGPSYAVPLARDIRQTFAVPTTDDECQFFYTDFDATRTVSGKLSGSDNMLERLALKLGLGYARQIAPNLDLTFQAGYALGVSDLLSADETMDLRNPDVSAGSVQQSLLHRNLRFNAIQGSLGLRVNF